MRAVGLKTLKNKLSRYIRIAASGEVVLVTDRDRVVAEIRPAGRAEWLADASLAEAVRSRLLRPPALSRVPLLPRRPVAKTTEILTELDRDRSES